jgi:hypothetical protein
MRIHSALSALILFTILFSGACVPNDTISSHNSISGHVYDMQSHTPVKNASIRIEQIRVPPPTVTQPVPGTPDPVLPLYNPIKLETRTNAKGYYSIKGLPIGDYSITATAVKYVEYRASFTITEVSNVVKDLEISKGSSISGHIYRAGDMKPIAGAKIQVWPNFVSPYQTTTAAGGSYTIDLREGGTWTVWAGGSGYVTKIYDGATGSYDGKIQYKVVTQNGTSALNTDFVLERGGSISGQILESDGITPAANAYIQYMQTSGTKTPELWKTDLPSPYPPIISADASGRYVLGERLTGTYQIKAVRFSDNKTSPYIEVEVVMGQNTIQNFIIK